MTVENWYLVFYAMYFVQAIIALCELRYIPPRLPLPLFLTIFHIIFLLASSVLFVYYAYSIGFHGWMDGYMAPAYAVVFIIAQATGIATFYIAAVFGKTSGK